MTYAADDIPYPPDYGAPQGTPPMTPDTIKRHIAKWQSTQAATLRDIGRREGAIAALQALLTEAETPAPGQSDANPTKPASVGGKIPDGIVETPALEAARTEGREWCALMADVRGWKGRADEQTSDYEQGARDMSDHLSAHFRSAIDARLSTLTKEAT